MNPGNEIIIRLAVFAGVFVLLALAEAAAPRRKLSTKKSMRWASNLGLVCLNNLLLALILRFVLPMGAMGMAVLAEGRWGLFNNFDGVPYWLAVVLSVLAL